MGTPAQVIVKTSCPGQVEVITKPVPPIAVSCGMQGPPGPPGYASLPFYLTDGIPAHIALIAESLPFYLADGTPSHIALV